MNRATLQRRLQEAEDLVRHMEENIAFQRQMIARLERGGHDVRAANMFLRRLETKQARQVSDRDRLLKAVSRH